MKKKLTLIFIIAATLVVLFINPTGLKAFDFQLKSDASDKLQKLNIVADMIQSSYVNDVPGDKLHDAALNGMLKSLDPYSLYMDKTAYEELKAQTQGHFAGVGIEISNKGGFLHVIAAFDESPAYLAGILPQDVISKINGVSTKDMNLFEAVKVLRGMEGTEVVLTILREGENKPLEVKVIRKTIQVKGIREAKILEPGIGYVRISEFQEKTVFDLKSAIAELQKNGAKALIVDIRSNPGGLLESGIHAAELFIPKGLNVVSTKGRTPSQNRKFDSGNSSPIQMDAIAVLINRGSASSSEIFTGALKDHKLATVFGKKSYGKGCVQTLNVLKDGSAVRITTSHYYTPSGLLIDEKGITPDFEVSGDVRDNPDAALEKATLWVKEKLNEKTK